MDYITVIEKLTVEDGGGYIAYCPSLPGCYTTGETSEEALENLYEAIDLTLIVMKKRGIKPPPKEYYSVDRKIVFIVQKG